MAYPLSVGDIAEITFLGECFGQKVMTVLHYQMVSGSPIPDGATGITALIADAQSQMRASYLNCCGGNYTLSEITGQKVYTDRYQRISAIQSGQSGTGGEVTTLTNSAVITKRAQEATRHGIGSVHLPAVPGDAMVNGVFTGGYQALMATFAATLDNGLSAGGSSAWSGIILNRASPGGSLRIFNLKVQPEVRTMRRRVVGRGI